jgi:serine phosphatase RsbU (regulator of sigma subunit)
MGDESNFQETERAWKYHSGDDTAWANPNFNDTYWGSLKPAKYSHTIKDYTGIAWFRYKITITDSLINKPLAFVLKHFGASEIYFQGRLLKKYGTVSANNQSGYGYDPGGEPVKFVVSEPGEYVIAVRYSNHNSEYYLKTYNEDFAGFTCEILDEETASWKYKYLNLFESVLFAFSIGFFFILGLLHCAIFFFYKRERSNLYYTVFAFSLAIYFLVLLTSHNISDPSTILFLKQVSEFLGIIQSLSLLALVYSFTYTKMPKRFWVGFVIGLITLVLFFVAIKAAVIISGFLQILCYIDGLRLIIIRLLKKYDPDKKRKKRLKYAFLILGLILIITAFINYIIPLVIIGVLIFLLFLPLVGSIFVIPIYMSIRHARSFSTANKNLEEQLIRVQELSAKSLEQEKEKQKIIEVQKEHLEVQVKERTAELVQKNQEITDSINYAKRIQSAILPPLDNICSVFPDSFVLYKPKDIVSGDFYWLKENENGFLIAAADCTGHGVPGAFMSVISSEKLTIAAQQTSHVSEILKLTNLGIKSSLRQTNSDDSTRDGMDISLCHFDKQFLNVTYAGANRPLWLIRKNSEVITEIKATKTAIGGLTNDDQNFDSNMLQLSKEDTLYLFTDGYADQFSPQDKKLMTRKFKELILSIQNKNMQAQKEFLEDFINNWKGNMEQTDDILVIGIRV